MGAGRIQVAALPLPTLEYDAQDQEQLRAALRASLEDVERIVADIEANTTAEIALVSLDELADVTVTSIASGELLKWDGAAWINQTLAEAGIAAASHTHLEADITDLGSYGDITGAETVSGAWTHTSTLKTNDTTFIAQWEDMTPVFYLRHYRDTGGGGGSTPWVRVQNDEGTSATPVKTPSNRWLGGMNWAGSTGSGFVDVASVLAVANEAIDASNQGSRIRFRATAIGASSVNDVMAIYGEGVVIGQTDSGTTLPFGGGVGCVFLRNRTTAPTSDPSNGGLLYAQGGALLWRGAGGKITTIAASA